MGTSATTIYESVVPTDDATPSAAITANADTIWVKSGSYGTFTQDQANSYMYFEPGTVITGAISVTGANAGLHFGAGCDIQGLITVSADGCFLKFENGCDVDGILLNNDKCFVDGGGWGTLSSATATPALEFSTANDNIVQNIAVNTPSGTGGGNRAIKFTTTGDRNVLSHFKIVDSDDRALELNTGCDVNLIYGGTILDGDTYLISNAALANRIIGNKFVINGADSSIKFWGGAQDGVVFGNIVKDPANYSIDMGGADHCVVANRLDGTPNDTSTGSTVAQNNVAAF